jgi:mono/diheme cytochrome c family protein
MLKPLIFAAALVASPVLAQDKAFTLQVPDALTERGFTKHLLPRFSLKTGIRITVSPEAGEAAFGTEGRPVFRQGKTIWHLSKPEGDPEIDAFEDWLVSDVGKRTIEAFTLHGDPIFSADVAVKAEQVAVALTGDAALGETLSLSQCGRCHVINESNRMNAIGSSPSFRLMRTFPDWQERFETFFLLKPHPAFTQVTDVTEPFPEHLPSPIVPIELTLEQIEAITAYVGSITPADLGAPIQTQ